MQTVTEMGPRLGFAATCAAMGLPRATFYRRLKPRIEPAKRSSHRALGADEKRAVLDVLHEPRFADLAPAEVYAMLLDEGRYLCSERTMYRILAENAELRERRDQLRHPNYKAPELLATAPNQLWSWDITKLLGPQKWTYFYLYVILDVFSRYVVGWMLAHRESGTLAERLIAETCERQHIQRDQLTLHADRGTSMQSKPVALLLSDLSDGHSSRGDLLDSLIVLARKPPSSHQLGCACSRRGRLGDRRGQAGRRRRARQELPPRIRRRTRSAGPSLPT
jgi:putative transposase